MTKGNPGFITYGTTTDSNDQGIVTYNLVIGKYQGHIPKVGTFFNFLKSVPGYFICIFTPFFILILVQARNSIKLFRKYKKEQVEEIQAEKKAARGGTCQIAGDDGTADAHAAADAHRHAISPS